MDRKSAWERRVDAPETFSRWKPGIWTFRDGNREILVKDVFYTHPLYRFTLGRWGTSREKRIYSRLNGLSRIPQCFGTLDPDALLFEKLDAKPLHRAELPQIQSDFFDQLKPWIEQLHEKGVVHLDLRQKRNILIGTDQKPWVVDFGGAIYLGTNPFSRHILFPLFAWIDRSAILKYRLRYFPHLASEKERKQEQRLRWIRRLWVFSPHKRR